MSFQHSSQRSRVDLQSLSLPKFPTSGLDLTYFDILTWKYGKPQLVSWDHPKSQSHCVPQFCLPSGHQRAGHCQQQCEPVLPPQGCSPFSLDIIFGHHSVPPRALSPGGQRLQSPVNYKSYPALLHVWLHVWLSHSRISICSQPDLMCSHRDALTRPTVLSSAPYI